MSSEMCPKRRWQIVPRGRTIHGETTIFTVRPVLVCGTDSWRESADRGCERPAESDSIDCEVRRLQTTQAGTYSGAVVVSP